MNTSFDGIADIVCTDVVISTIGGSRPSAPATLTTINGGTGIAVVARLLIGSEGATGLGRTCIISAGVAVAARQFATALALPELADIIGGAEITVVTGSLIEEVQTPAVGIARIRSTDIVVITIGEPTLDATPG